MKTPTFFRLLILAGPLGLAAAESLHRTNTPGGVVDCTSRSAAIRNLTVYGTEILYTVTPPTQPGGNSSANGTDTSTSFEFQMYNAVLDVDAQCSTHVSQASSDAAAAVAAATWHTCFVESRDTRITAAFRFDLQRHELTINETWVCDDAGGTNNATTTATFQASATNGISTLCQETINETLGQHYCAEIPDLPLPVNVTRI